MAGIKKAPGAITPAAETAIKLGFTIYCIFCIIPIVLVFVISFTSESDIMKYGYSFLPNSLTLDAYKFVLSDWKSVLSAYGVSIFITVAGTIFGCLITALFAYPLSRRDFPYRKFFAFAVAFTMLFNGGLVPWYATYVKLLGVKNSYLALIIPLLINGFNVIILRTFMMNNIPHELIESLKIDGANELQVFYKIVLPLSLPGLATVSLFLALSYWNDWYNALLFIDNKKLFPLQYLMYKVNASINVLNTSNFVGDTAKAGFVRPSDSAKMAMAVLGIGPIILAYPFLQKYFVKGLTLGSVKG